MFKFDLMANAKAGEEFSALCVSTQEKITSLILRREQIIVRINALMQQVQRKYVMAFIILQADLDGLLLLSDNDSRDCYWLLGLADL